MQELTITKADSSQFQSVTTHFMPCIVSWNHLVILMIFLVILVYFKDFLGIFKGFLSIGSRGRCTFWWIISPRPGAQPPNIDIPIKAPQNKCCRHKALFLQEWEREFISQHLYFEIFLRWSYYDSAFCDSQTLNSQVGGWKLLLAKDCFQNARLPN